LTSTLICLCSPPFELASWRALRCSFANALSVSGSSKSTREHEQLPGPPSAKRLARTYAGEGCEGWRAHPRARMHLHHARTVSHASMFLQAMTTWQPCFMRPRAISLPAFRVPTAA
jgi:hypothetical protein